MTIRNGETMWAGKYDDPDAQPDDDRWEPGKPAPGWASYREPRRTLTDADRGPFGAHLKRVREARKISQSRLAELADYDHSFVSRLEAGSRSPTRDAVQRLAVALQLPPVEADRLLAAAGFLPRDTASLLETEPEVASLLTALHDEALPIGLRELLRDQLAGLAAICAVDRGVA